jgi:hypothetical protein
MESTKTPDVEWSALPLKEKVQGILGIILILIVLMIGGGAIVAIGVVGAGMVQHQIHQLSTPHHSTPVTKVVHHRAAPLVVNAKPSPYTPSPAPTQAPVAGPAPCLVTSSGNTVCGQTADSWCQMYNESSAGGTDQGTNDACQVVMKWTNQQLGIG